MYPIKHLVNEKKHILSLALKPFWNTLLLLSLIFYSCHCKWENYETYKIKKKLQICKCNTLVSNIATESWDKETVNFQMMVMKCHRQYQFLSNYDVMTSVVIVFYVKEMVQLIFQWKYFQLPGNKIKASRYCLCRTIDDVIPSMLSQLKRNYHNIF